MFRILIPERDFEPQSRTINGYVFHNEKHEIRVEAVDIHNVIPMLQSGQVAGLSLGFDSYEDCQAAWARIVAASNPLAYAVAVFNRQDIPRMRAEGYDAGELRHDADTNTIWTIPYRNTNRVVHE